MLKLEITAISTFALIFFTHSALSQGNSEVNKKSSVTRVKVFDNFIGQGYKMATDAAILNSKKGVLIVLLSTTTDTKLYEDVIDVTDTEAAFGRTRMVIILADPAADTIRNHVSLFANGKGCYTAFELSGNRGLGSGVEFSQDLRKIYDAEIKPLEKH